jgi:ABC-2 type transport system ATP-binding protein
MTTTTVTTAATTTEARQHPNWPTASPPVVQVNNLNLDYGDFRAVTDLTFHVQRGELYALLGTNGAGKTSALEIIEGHRRPSSGTVHVFGHSPMDRPMVRPQTGIMLQDSGFVPDLTVSETMRLVGVLSQRHDRVDRLLSLVDLKRKAHTLVSQLSGGEKRRLDFGTAIWGTPELVFLDEPTTGLDIASRDNVWDIVARLRETGTTVILTTHYLEEAQQHADRVGLMHHGRLRREGTVAQLTRMLPSIIRFSLGHAASAPPRQAVRQRDGSFIIETFALPADLKALLSWSEDHDTELHGLSAGPTGLDDVFRSLNTEDTVA